MTSVSLQWPMRVLLGLTAVTGSLWRWWLRRRLKAGKEHSTSFSQKLLLHLDDANAPRPNGLPLVWGHAVSVGEVLAMLGVFRRLAIDFPQVQFLLTSSTVTSGQALAKQDMPTQIQHQYAPLDQPDLVRRFLSHWRPKIAIWLQSDLWPHTVLETRATGIPMLMLNARLSASKISRRRQVRWFYEPLFASFTEIFAQNEECRKNLNRLGIPMRLCAKVGNVKALAPPIPVSATALHAFQSNVCGRPVWLLASSHAGEEAIAMRAHSRVLQHHSNALLIIAPRHIAASKQWVDLANGLGLTAERRSEQASPHLSTHVYVGDTMGEMGLWYAVAQVALIGGSMVPHGGHNPYEASSAGCPVLHGPYIANCQESYDDLGSRGLAQMVRNEDELANCVLMHLGGKKAAENNPDLSVRQNTDDAMYEHIRSYIQTISHAKL